MDVDMEVEGKLLQQFCCMGTYDREVLVEQFQQIVGPDANLSSDSCRFFLDMNNWNLPAALGSYYDFSAQELVSLPSVSFLNDVTIGEGESVPPNTRFTKVWRLCNPGSMPWPEGCTLRHVAGERMADATEIPLRPLCPNEVDDVCVPMTSPAEKGTYQSRWQMVTSQGIPVGDIIWCIVTVDESGLLDLTQMLAQTTCNDPAAAGQGHAGAGGLADTNSATIPTTTTTTSHLGQATTTGGDQDWQKSRSQRSAGCCCNDVSFEPAGHADSEQTRVSVTADLLRNPLSAEASRCNTALYTCVSDALSHLNSYPSRTLPVNIPKPYNAGDGAVPPVPPCTPCSPCFIASMQSSQNVHGSTIVTPTVRGARPTTDQFMDDQ